MAENYVNETQEVATARIVAETARQTAKAVLDAAQAAAILIAKDNTTVSNEIAVLKTEMVMVKNQQIAFESEMNRRMDGLDPKFDKIFAKLEEISLGRPTWAVTIILSLLSSLCIGLAVFVATH